MPKNGFDVMREAQLSVRAIGENNGGGWAMQLSPGDPEEWVQRADKCADNLRTLLGHHIKLTQLITDAMMDLHRARRWLEMCEEEDGANCDD